MGAPVEDLQRLGLKLFAADGTSIRPREFVPIFHRWIQSGALPGHLLIDVADYEHVPNGPGVLLAAHEGNLCTDLADGRLGLAYNRKKPLPGSLADRLREVTRIVLAAGRSLEDEAPFRNRLRFRGDQLYVFANDRLLAPNTPAAAEGFRAAAAPLLRDLYGDTQCTVTLEPDGRERLGMMITARESRLDALLARLG